MVPAKTPGLIHSFHLSIPSLVLAVSMSVVTLSSGCKSSRGGDSFIMDTGVALTTETAVTSTRPLDNGQSFRLGYGYDNISGQRHSSCLDPTTFTIVGRNLRSTDMHFSIINNKEDLAKELNIKVNAEASGSYGSVTGSATSKVNILKKSSFSDHTVMGLVTLLHRAQTLELESDGDNIDLVQRAILSSNGKAFRRRCGDVYTRSATTGAALYIAVNIDAKSETISDHVESETEIKAAFANLISASTSTSVSKDTQKTLSKFTISMSCNSVGTSSDACAQPIVATNADDLASIIEFLNKAKTSFSASVDSNPNILVAVDELFQDYPKEDSATETKKFQVFYDYNPQLKIVQNLLQTEMKVNNYCGNIQYPSCERTRAAIASQIKNCAIQDDWPDCDPTQVSVDALNKEVSMADRGIVVLSSWSGITKKTSTLDFNTIAGKGAPLAANKIYNLTDLNFQDMATIYDADIKAGWQLRFFEHANGLGRCYLLTPASKKGNFQWFNRLASSFRMESAKDHEEICKK